MAKGDSLNYGRFMERAMRGLMAEVLGQVAEHGLPGEHYFYITFQTQHPGVDMPDFLRERYPAEMMIVLQEWFDDLAVMGDRFRVTLNFSNSPETLVVPFEAVKTFVDPSAKFGLKFDDHESDEIMLNIEEIEAADAEADDTVPGSAAKPAAEEKPKGPADVVSLDRFRKS